MVVVTHEMAFARRSPTACSSSISGVIVEQGPARDLLTDPQQPAHAGFPQARPAPDLRSDERPTLSARTLVVARDGRRRPRRLPPLDKDPRTPMSRDRRRLCGPVDRAAPRRARRAARGAGGEGARLWRLRPQWRPGHSRG